jgi:hypothetical protein
VWVVAAAAALSVGAWYVWGRDLPQMGSDERVFSAVDALYTAVTSRQENLIDDCETRLHKLRDDGKLPPESGDALDGIIKHCRGGDWETAARELYRYIQAQRR